jgi:hypothetical protein
MTTVYTAYIGRISLISVCEERKGIGMKLRIKLLISMFLVVASIVAGLSYWNYIYLPNKEMSQLEFFRNKLIVNFEEIYPFPPGSKEKANLFLKTRADIAKVKRDINENKVNFRTEKAQKVSALLLSTAQYMDKLCEHAWYAENELIKGEQFVDQRTEKEFDRHSEEFYKTRDKLEDELLPQLDGYFKQK